MSKERREQREKVRVRILGEGLRVRHGAKSYGAQFKKTYTIDSVKIRYYRILHIFSELTCN